MTSLKGVSSMKLHRDLDVTQTTAWFMLQRVRAAFAPLLAAAFEGPVEADETYVGGLEKNKHEHRKQKSRTRAGRQDGGGRPEGPCKRADSGRSGGAHGRSDLTAVRLTRPGALRSMNLAIRGIEGQQITQGDSFHNDRHAKPSRPTRSLLILRSMSRQWGTATGIAGRTSAGVSRYVPPPSVTPTLPGYSISSISLAPGGRATDSYNRDTAGANVFQHVG